jgi:cell wall-associated NlpC family hydrolase
MALKITLTACLALALAPVFGLAKDNDPDRVVLGLVGQVIEPAKVYTKASTRSKAYFSVSAKNTLVVKTEAPKGWYKVLLTTGGYGYIPADSVDLVREKTETGVTYLEVTTDKKVAAPRASTQLVASRSGSRTTAAGRAWAAEKGLDFQGTPYVWGGNDIQNGIDCSGFVQKLYGAIGLQLPRTAAEQALVGTPVKRYEDLRKGDRLYFWDAKRGKIGHTGLYLGNWQFVHSSSTHKGVAVDDIRNPKWLKILISARR